MPIAISRPLRLPISPSRMSSSLAALTAMSWPALAANPPPAAANAVKGIEVPPVAIAAPIAPAIGTAAPAVSAKKSAIDVPSSSTARNWLFVSWASRYKSLVLPPISIAWMFSRPYLFSSSWNLSCSVGWNDRLNLPLNPIPWVTSTSSSLRPRLRAASLLMLARCSSLLSSVKPSSASLYLPLSNFSFALRWKVGCAFIASEILVTASSSPALPAWTRTSSSSSSVAMLFAWVVVCVDWIAYVLIVGISRFTLTRWATSHDFVKLLLTMFVNKRSLGLILNFF